MTETTTPAEPPNAATGSDTPPRPTDILVALVVTLLTPMFLGVSAGDIDLARSAAIETLNGYRARSHADLIAVAQIIAFGLGALGSLSLSLADDISLSMALRLRGNANACNRSAEQNRRALSKATKTRDDEPAHLPAHDQAEAAEDELPEPEHLLSLAAAQALAAEAEARLQPPKPAASYSPAPAPEPPQLKAAERRHQQMWAIAMVKESGEIHASVPNLPPAERKAAKIRAACLSTTAHQLLNPPGTI